MILNTLLETLQKNDTLSIYGQYPEHTTVRSVRLYDGTASPDTLYVVQDVKGKNYAEGVFYLLFNPSESIREVNIVSAYSRSPFPCFFNLVVGHFERETEEAALFRTLYTSFQTSDQPGDYLKTLLPIVGNDLMIVSNTYEIIASTLADDDPIVEERNGSRHLSSRILQALISTHLLEKVASARGAVFIPQRIFSVDAYACKVSVGDYFAGYVFLLQTRSAFESTASFIATVIAEICSLKVHRILPDSLIENVGEDYFMRTLLSETPDYFALSSMTEWKNHDKRACHQVILCTRPAEKGKNLLTHFYYLLKSIFNDCSIILLPQDVFAILISSKTRQMYSPEARQSFEHALLRNRQFAVESYIFYDLQSTNSYYQLCKYLLRQVTSRADARLSIYAMEHSFLQLLPGMANDQVDRQAVIHPDILFLMRYDETNHTELTGTLRSYLKHNRLISVMVQEMHISRSTGFYRINQIKDLLGDPFSSRERLFCYEGSFMMMEQEGVPAPKKEV